MPGRSVRVPLTRLGVSQAEPSTTSNSSCVSPGGIEGARNPGAAEVLYGLGAALGRRGGEDLGLIYLQLSLYLAPSHPLALLSLGDLYEAMKKPELANKAYE